MAGAVVLSASLAVAVPPLAGAAGAAAADCATMSQPVYQRNSPSTTTLISSDLNEVKFVPVWGFTDNAGLPFRAGTGPAGGLVSAHRMANGRFGDLVWITDPNEIAYARTIGFQDQGHSFWVASESAPCTVPVYRLRKGVYHRFATGNADRDAQVRGGWTLEGVAFYAAPPAPTPSGDTKFTIAVYPDTQQEVGRDTRFIQRAQWLISNASTLDTRFVIHTGDIVNWDTPEHDQYVVASNAMKPLEAAGIPYALAIGNHDAAATCPGGGGCPGPPGVKVTLRDTTTMNSFFPLSRFPAVDGTWPAGVIDNTYSTFEAGGRRWLVLAMEVWPRTEAVNWAKGVIAGHPDHNVILATHSYLTAWGDIYNGNDGYGANTPQYLYDNLVRPYPNVRLVFSGHTGYAASRIDTAEGGNSVAAFLGAFHSNQTNPIQLVEIDTAANTVSTRFYGPWNQQEWPEYARTVRGMAWVG